MFLYSVIIPTKDRPVITMRAITSILSQGRSDVQIIVSDNSDTDTLQNVLEPESINNLQYIRTGGLTASENWVAGAPYCEGKYILYLLDREVLLPGTLDRFAGLIEKYPDIPIGWQEALAIGVEPTPQEERLVASMELISGLISAACGVNNNIELRSHTVCYPKAIHEKVIAKLGNRIITDQAADLAGVLQMLFLVDVCLYIPERIKRTTLSSAQTVKSMLFPEETLTSIHLTMEETYSHVPIKFYLIFNQVLNGMLKLCEENGYAVSLSGEVLDEYFKYMYTLYMHAVRKYHIPAHAFMKSFYTAAVAHEMQGKQWFNEIFYFWNWPEGYSGE